MLVAFAFIAGVVVATVIHVLRLEKTASRAYELAHTRTAEKLRVARLACFQVISGEYEKDPDTWAATVRRSGLLTENENEAA